MTSPAAGGPNFPFGDDDIHAFVDGQLAPERRAEIQRWLDSDPEAASRAAFYARQNAAMHRRFDHILAEPIPRDWGPAPVWRRRIRDRRAPSVRHVGIPAAWLFPGLIAGWPPHHPLIPPPPPQRLAQQPLSLPPHAP